MQPLLIRQVVLARAAVEVNAGTVLAAAVHEVKAAVMRKVTAFAVSDPNGNVSPDGALHGRAEGVVGPVVFGLISVSGAVVSVPTTGSLLRCKRFVALGAAGREDREPGSGFAGWPSPRKPGCDLQAEQRRKMAWPPRTCSCGNARANATAMMSRLTMVVMLMMMMV